MQTDPLEAAREEYAQALAALAAHYPDLSRPDSRDSHLADRVVGKCLESRLFRNPPPGWTETAAQCALIASRSHSHWFRERGFDTQAASAMACLTFRHCLEQADKEAAAPSSHDLACLMRCCLRDSVPEEIASAALARAAAAPQETLAGAAMLFMLAMAQGGPFANSPDSAQKRAAQILRIAPLLSDRSIQKLLDQGRDGRPKFPLAHANACSELSRVLLSRTARQANAPAKNPGL